MIIKPGLGLGEIQQGMSESELMNIFGVPDFIDEDQYTECHGDRYRDLWYTNKNISLFWSISGFTDFNQLFLYLKDFV